MLDHYRARIIAAREARKVSQEEFSRLAGISQSTLSRIEAGERIDIKLQTAQQIARALEVLGG